MNGRSLNTQNRTGQNRHLFEKRIFRGSGTRTSGFQGFAPIGARNQFEELKFELAGVVLVSAVSGPGSSISERRTPPRRLAGSCSR
jgi:hypothetical protein